MSEPTIETPAPPAAPASVTTNTLVPTPTVTLSTAVPTTGPANPVTFTFKVNGQEVTDFSAVQAHIESLETFRNETRDNARKSFVAQLAKDNKILASQIPDLEKLVDLLDDTQYELWMASWSAAPVQTLLQTPAVNTPDSPGGAEKNQADEIAKWEGIVKQHKLGGMKPEAIKSTESYKNLIRLVPDYQL